MIEGLVNLKGEEVKLSVAMCTYNGARYLSEQLESIAAQSRPPCELVICDDCSVDNTPEIVREFAAHVSFPVRLYINERNSGSTENFEQAISLCEGDMIALADQDDVWLSHKLARLEAVLATSPEIGIVFSDARIVNESLSPFGCSLLQHTLNQRARRLIKRGRTFEALLERNFVTGATMAFRSNLRQFFMPIPNLRWLIHDGWIALVAAAVSDIGFIEEALILYRQHAQQQIGVSVRLSPTSTMVSSPDMLREGANACSLEIRDVDLFCKTLLEVSSNRPDLTKKLQAAGRQKRRLMDERDHLHRRAEIVSSEGKMQRLILILEELAALRYHNYSRGVLSAAKDLLSTDSHTRR